MKEKVLVGDLKPGMYVFELDRPWLDTPYPMQGFRIESQEEVDEVKKYCEFVYIDPLKTHYAGSTSRMRLAGHIVGSSAAAEGAAHQFVRIQPGAVTYVDEQPVEKELPRARQVHTSAQEVIRRIRDGIQKTGRLDVKTASALVENLADSIVSNPDALLLLAQFRRKAASTYEQAISVSIYMIAFGRQMGLPRDELSLLGLAGLLLDIGKLNLPVELLEKGSYAAAEYALMKRHVAFGEELLRKSPGIPDKVIEIVAQHHERENGSGYPRGLLGSGTSVYGKMASIVDCFRELSIGQPNATPLPAHVALEMMHGWAGRFFHPTLLENFIQCVGIYPVGSLVELNTDEVAVVIAHNRVRRLRPRIMVILDSDRKPYSTPKMVDLMYEPLSDFGVSYEIKRGLEPGMYGIDPKDYYL